MFASPRCSTPALRGAVVAAGLLSDSCFSSSGATGEYRGTVDWEGLSGTIAFATGYGSVAVLRSATKEAKTVSTVDGARIWEGSAAISPDGREVAYAGYKFTYSGYRVFVMGIDGTDRVELPCEQQNDCVAPVWSRGGTDVFYLRGASGAGGVVKAHPDGSEFDALPLDNVDKIGISPTGDRLALSASRAPTDGAPERSIRIVYPNGAEAAAQVYGPRRGLNPSWSPDGSKIAFVRIHAASDGLPECDIEIEIADLTRGERVTVVHQPHDCRQPYMERPSVEFSPDGTHLLFNGWTAADSAAELYLVAIDGSGLRRVTQGGARGVSWIR